ncbi:MAG: acyl-CoA dehydrogenase [Myxococcales bacterium]|nr:acyl-CoA dehydrogenase [Myxococcales bacterium]
MAEDNPLLSDRHVAFMLHEVLDAQSLCALPYFAEHSRETFDLFVGACAKLSREALLPAYKSMDEEAAHFEDGRVHTHPVMRELYPQMVELGMLTAVRPFDVDGQQMPLTVASSGFAYAMAANLSAFGFCMLTTGAAHLIESFGSETLKRDYMRKMYSGEWTGTMALTEPGAGSSLGDLRTRARPTEQGHYLIDGAKVFISGGDNSLSENIVHLALARIEGAPAGSRGISLFAVPRLRIQDGALVPNDVQAAGTFHKLGWRGIPSIALNFGDGGDCHGYLVGEPHKGLSYMFQMMNEARIHIGLHAVATAAVAYQESLEYARTRPQGRLPGMAADEPPVPIIQHPDVRRMLLRQKAIVEGGLALVLATARYADLSLHAVDDTQRERASAMLELLTPITKTFPSEKGFESNALAVQIHGGYGYTSEYLPEAWLRDQKLNSIHEGTTGIQSMDLLGRKVLKTGGASVTTLADEIEPSLERARSSAHLASHAGALETALARVREVSEQLLGTAMENPMAALSHSVDYLDMLATLVIGWQWLEMATAAQRGLNASPGDADALFYDGKLRAAAYWMRTELPRVAALADLCVSCEDSFSGMDPESF